MATNIKRSTKQFKKLPATFKPGIVISRTHKK
ncbi:hypothetical protein COLO4_27545 [Corchorus olitorius]|uniref:Uncharacterized protein n=1 Tax=Corchorus olitorius TaxID=93759 RepID=A0A1R3HQE0_9ROSI|nr:hypothetical protein COLO4_27545 [Corchorus olitorius]